MTKSQTGAKVTAERERERVLSELRLLIEALDRRVPQLDRLGESGIAEDAAELRRRAIALIAQMRATDAEKS